jgi:hypothetical protein
MTPGGRGMIDDGQLFNESFAPNEVMTLIRTAGG